MEAAMSPRFGEWLTGILASEDNPHRHGMYVRTVVRPRGGMNPGTFYEVTDGQGDFWLCPAGSTTTRVFTADEWDARVTEMRRNLAFVEDCWREALHEERSF